MSNRNVFTIIALLIAAAGTAYFFNNRQFSIDDSYITYRYADNLRNSYGLRFNVSEKYYGTTAMGYAALLGVTASALEEFTGLFHRPTQPTDLPRIAVFFSALSIWGMAIVYFLAAAAIARRSIAVVSTVFFAFWLFFSLPMHTVAGHETYPFIFVSFAATYVLMIRNRPIPAGLLMALATTFRPDVTALFLTSASLYFLFGWLAGSGRGYFRQTFRYGVTYGTAIGAWAIFLFASFGRVIPGTMAAKQAQVITGHYRPFTFNIAWNEIASYMLPTFLISCSILALIVLNEIRRRRKAAPAAGGALPPELAAGSIALTWGLFGAEIFATYIFLKVSFSYWYVIPSFFALLVAGFILIARAVEYAWPEKLALTPRLALVAAVLAPIVVNDLPKKLQNGFLIFSYPMTNPHLTAYDEIVDYLRKTCPDGATVSTCEPGGLGYKLGAKFTIIDEMGLITPGVSERLVQGDYDWTFRQFRPDYAICAYGVGEGLVCNIPWTTACYEKVGEFNRKYWGRFRKGEGALLFRRRCDLDSPARMVGFDPGDAQGNISSLKMDGVYTLRSGFARPCVAEFQVGRRGARFSAVVSSDSAMFRVRLRSGGAIIGDGFLVRGYPLTWSVVSLDGTVSFEAEALTNPGESLILAVYML